MSDTEQKTQIQFNTYTRVKIEQLIEGLRGQSKSIERDQAILKLKEAIMWLGEDSRVKRVNKELWEN